MTFDNALIMTFIGSLFLFVNEAKARERMLSLDTIHTNEFLVVCEQVFYVFFIMEILSIWMILMC